MSEQVDSKAGIFHNAVEERPSPIREFWHYFRENRGAVIGLFFFLFICAVALLANVIAPHSPIEQYREALLTPPVWQDGGDWRFILGTDAVGRDILSRLIYGSRFSLFVGCIVVSLSLFVGVTIGLFSGYIGGAFDAIIMRVMDIILAFPALLLALALVAILGPSLTNAMIAIAIVQQPHYVRLTRAAVMGERSKDYVTAAKVSGVGSWRLMFFTILPNCMAPLIVQAALSFSNAILDAAALGFLGMGAQPPTPEWGTMLAEAREFILRAWWVVTLPGLAILLTVLAINLMGDGLRDALDPKPKTFLENVMSLLEIENLTVEFATAGGAFRAVDNVSMNVDSGDVLAIVGESGSGKSVAMLAVMGLLPWTANVSADRMVFEGRELLTMNKKQRRDIIGKDITMIFQEPMTSLNPCFTIGFQIGEAIKAHVKMSRQQRRQRAIEILELVGIPAPEKRLSSFPHQLSGGMNQRVMIAMSIACNPKLIIADEPTTALDVTIQAQILELLLGLQKDNGMALILITHDMGVVAETAQRVAVQYAGQKIEEQAVQQLFDNPHHPYTAALLSALPERATSKKLPSIPGVVPGQFDRPDGCLFSPRCAQVADLCRADVPPQQDKSLGYARCHFPLTHDNLKMQA